MNDSAPPPDREGESMPRKKQAGEDDGIRQFPTQAPLPGAEREAIVDLEAAAEELFEVRDRRMTLTKKETELVARVLELMKKHDLPIYKNNGVELERIPA